MNVEDIDGGVIVVCCGSETSAFMGLTSLFSESTLQKAGLQRRGTCVVATTLVSEDDLVLLLLLLLEKFLPQLVGIVVVW